MAVPKALAIVGAGPGLGFALARRFAKEGWSLALVALRQQVIDAGLAELEQFDVNTCGVQADVDRPPLGLSAPSARLSLPSGCPMLLCTTRDLPGRELVLELTGRGAPAGTRYSRRRRTQHGTVRNRGDAATRPRCATCSR